MPASDWKIVPLPPAWEPAWRASVAAVQWTQPAFSHLYYSMMNKTGDRHIYWFSRDLPTLATDGARMYANPEYYFGLTLGQQVFGACHEVTHAMWRQPWQVHWHNLGNKPVVWKGKSLPFDFDTCNIAMDYGVNAFLIEGKVGEFKRGWYYNPRIATSFTTWQEVYHKIWEDCQAQKQGKSDGPSITDENGNPVPGPGQMVDQHLPPGTSDGKAPEQGMAEEPSEIAWQMAVKAAVTVAEQAGRVPENLRKAFGEILEPRVEWTEHVTGFLARRCGGGGYDYTRADRRLIMRNIVAPLRSGNGCGIIVIGGDTSGSIYANKGQIERIFAELCGVMDGLKPRRVIVVWCDAKVQRVDELDDVGDVEILRAKGTKGGGGTSFVPVFQYIEKEGINPDALIYFTDLEGTFPAKAPDYPVVWGNILDNAKKAPWGETVRIPA